MPGDKLVFRTSMDKQIDPFPPHDHWDCMAKPPCPWVSSEQWPDSGKTAFLQFVFNEQVADLLSGLNVKGQKNTTGCRAGRLCRSTKELIAVACSVLASEAKT